VNIPVDGLWTNADPSTPLHRCEARARSAWGTLHRSFAGSSTGSLQLWSGLTRVFRTVHTPYSYNLLKFL
jgi:hypothetical protein